MTCWMPGLLFVKQGTYNCGRVGLLPCNLYKYKYLLKYLDTPEHTPVGMLPVAKIADRDLENNTNLNPINGQAWPGSMERSDRGGGNNDRGWRTRTETQ